MHYCELVDPARLAQLDKKTGFPVSVLITALHKIAVSGDQAAHNALNTVLDRIDAKHEMSSSDTLNS